MLDAVKRLSSEAPDFQVLDGFDANGDPVYRSVADALSDIEAERQSALKDSQAFPAAFACVMRRGFDAS